MMLWQWNEEAAAYAAEALHEGQAYPLSPAARLMPLRGGRCGLLARGAATVNGLFVLPLQMLIDKDEIRVEGEMVYFSADAPAEAVAFTTQEHAMACGRCKGKISEGELAVQCPLCGAWHHQTEALACWAEDAKCSGCERSTKRINWQPEPRGRKRTGK